MAERTQSEGQHRVWSSEDNPYKMGCAIVRQRDPCLIFRQRIAVELRSDDSAADAAWVLDPYVVLGGAVSEDDSEARPCFWYARI